MHRYRADPQSGAGNCQCGRAERHMMHPHAFMPAAINPDICTCTRPESADIHMFTDLKDTDA